MECRIGLAPDLGSTWLLPRLAGWEQASRFYFLGEDEIEWIVEDLFVGNKLEQGAMPRVIHTVRGVGYVLAHEPPML